VPKNTSRTSVALAMQLRVNIHGKVLVDGHHLLLEMLRDIETFNHYVEEHPKFLRGARNIWIDPRPVNVAEATGDVIKILQKTLPLEIAQRLADRTRSVSQLLSAKCLQEPASRYSTVDGHSDILIFDARMPPVANAIKELEKKRRICLRQVLRLYK
jgi:hypothetical protein